MQIDRLSAAIDYGVIGLLLVLSIIVVAIAFERIFFYRTVDPKAFASIKLLDRKNDRSGRPSSPRSPPTHPISRANRHTCSPDVAIVPPAIEPSRVLRSKVTGSFDLGALRLVSGQPAIWVFAAEKQPIYILLYITWAGVMAIEALVTLEGENVPAVGRDRLRLLEAVAREGSISAGARAIGITYKAAWDGLDAMANLFGKPLLVGRAGGRAGGGATLTPIGKSLCHRGI